MIDKINIKWPIDDLPKTCIYSVQKDSYTCMYDVDEFCSCGCKEWVDSVLIINVFEQQIPLIPKNIQRCSSCQKTRLMRMKPEYIDIIESSKTVLKALSKVPHENGDVHIWGILKNMISNLEIEISKKTLLKPKQEKISSIEKIYFDENQKAITSDSMKNIQGSQIFI